MAKDFVRDANPKALYLAGLHIDLPDYLKEYEMPSEEAMQKLAAAAFADQRLKLHPIHTKEAAVLSGIYLQGSGLGASEQMQHVKQAAEIFGVSEDLNKILEQMSSVLEKKASETEVAEKEYAMLVEGENETITALYPINNEVQVCKSAQSLYNDFIAGKFPADWAHNAAVALVKKANVLGVERNDLPERIWVLGTERMPDFDTAIKMAKYRDYDGADSESSELYQEIAKSAAADPENLEDYLKLWADLDMAQGIGYKETFTPQEAFYSGPALSELEKAASAVVIVKDVMVPKHQFSKLSASDVQTSFREEIADVVHSIVKLAAEDPALATQYASVLDADNQDILIELLLG